MNKDQMRHTVLMVEDDPLEIELVRSAAAESCQNLDLVVLQDTDAVLGWLSGDAAKNRQMPSVILIDLKLPKLGGLAVLRKLRMNAVARDVPILAFSAEYTRDEVQMSYRAGANSFVAKPAGFQQFIEFFCEKIPYWLEPRQRALTASC